MVLLVGGGVAQGIVIVAIKRELNTKDIYRRGRDEESRKTGNWGQIIALEEYFVIFHFRRGKVDTFI